METIEDFISYRDVRNSDILAHIAEKANTFGLDGMRVSSIHAETKFGSGVKITWKICKKK